MPGFFRKNNKEPQSPIKAEMRQWMEASFRWLMKSFGENEIKNRKILTPHYSDFPVRYNGTPETAEQTVKILASQMEIDSNEITLFIYGEGESEVSTGSPLGTKLFLSQFDDEKYSGGLYFGKEDDGKYHIALEKKKLLTPETMVATLDHELAHIKLLGEGRITENDERLTDLTTIIFGLGIFNANAAFMTYNGIGYRGWSKLGYLTQMEWGYGLALFAAIRNEKKPEWISHLSKNVKSDFLISERFIEHNRDNIFTA